MNGEPMTSETLRTKETSAAVRDVLAERQRQIDVEQWNHEHDDGHRCNELARAAAAYAYVAGLTQTEKDAHKNAIFGQHTGFHSLVSEIWPWAAHWFKPKSEREDLVRASALIIADIERIDRSEERRRNER